MKKNHLFSIITAGMLTITLLAGCGTGVTDGALEGEIFFGISENA